MSKYLEEIKKKEEEVGIKVKE
jgi:hypothetical protein